MFVNDSFAGVLKELVGSFPNLAMTADTSNATALDTAATQGHIDVVNLLLETDSNLAKITRNNGKTVLHSAARMGHLEVVRSLLGKDPSIGFRTDKKGQTALHMAVKGQNVEIVLELLKPDRSVMNLEDNKGNTALHIATRKGCTQVFPPSIYLTSYLFEFYFISNFLTLFDFALQFCINKVNKSKKVIYKSNSKWALLMS